MKIISTAQYTVLPDGKKKVRAFLLSDTLPAGFPDSTASLTAEFPDYVFDTATVLQVLDSNATNSVYIVREDGDWQAIDGAILYMIN